MWPFTKNIGLVDKVINKRVGILFLDIGYSSISIKEQARVIKNQTNYNAIVEVMEIYNDKIFSKIQVINIAYNSSDKSNRYISRRLKKWVESYDIHWLSPSVPIDRDNKLEELLDKKSES